MVRVQTPEDVAEVFRQLRRMRRMVDKGWVGHGGLFGWNVHALILSGEAGPRYLKAKDLRPYTQGFFDAKGAAGELTALDASPVPEIVTQREVAARLGVNFRHAMRPQTGPGGPRSLFKTLRDYYPVYKGFQRRNVIACEVAAEQVARSLGPLDPAPVEEWAAVRATLPERLEHPVEAIVLSGREPGVSPTMLGVDRRQAVLAVAEKRGWVKLVRNEGGRTYSLLAPVADGGPAERVWSAQDLEPYVWGLGDAHGEGWRVTSRDGLS